MWDELEAERRLLDQRDEGMFAAAFAVGTFAIVCGVIVFVALLKLGWL